MSWILLIRHVECYKNIRDEHGGKGDNLTAHGYDQINVLIKRINYIKTKFFSEKKLEFNGVWYSEIIQIEETAKLLADSLSLETIYDQRIRPLDLGILSGLSKKDALKRHPKAASELEKWRQGKLEIRNLILPGAENFQSFYQRGQDFIQYISKNKINSIIIGSRSILTLLTNILLARDPYKNKQYHPWIFDLASICLFSHDKNWNLIYSEGVYNFEYKALRVNI